MVGVIKSYIFFRNIYDYDYRTMTVQPEMTTKLAEAEGNFKSGLAKQGRSLKSIPRREMASPKPIPQREAEEL